MRLCHQPKTSERHLHFVYLGSEDGDGRAERGLSISALGSFDRFGRQPLKASKMVVHAAVQPSFFNDLTITGSGRRRVDLADYTDLGCRRSQPSSLGSHEEDVRGSDTDLMPLADPDLPRGAVEFRTGRRLTPWVLKVFPADEHRGRVAIGFQEELITADRRYAETTVGQLKVWHKECCAGLRLGQGAGRHTRFGLRPMKSHEPPASGG